MGALLVISSVVSEVKGPNMGPVGMSARVQGTVPFYSQRSWWPGALSTASPRMARAVAGGKGAHRHRGPWALVEWGRAVAVSGVGAQLLPSGNGGLSPETTVGEELSMGFCG